MQKVILDCDPGQDDAVALLLALAHPTRLRVLGITTVAGNVPLALTQRNARIMCAIAGSETNVYAGCDRPLNRELVTAEEVHGRTGIDGIDITEPDLPLHEQHAVDFIIETLLASEPESVTLVPMGPLTNIAKAIQTEPRILGRIKEVVLMGRCHAGGGQRHAKRRVQHLRRSRSGGDGHAVRSPTRCDEPGCHAPGACDAAANRSHQEREQRGLRCGCRHAGVLQPV